MVRCLVAAAIVLGGCYNPSGVPCSSARDCPEGNVCAANRRCEEPRDGDSDTPIDALGAWSAPMPLVELNTLSAETDPSITADGLDIVFASDRPGGVGAMDLYRAHRNSITEPFGMPVLIAELSTIAADQAAELSGDGLTIYVRKMGTTSQDIFTARRATRQSMFDTPTLELDFSSTEEETNPAISADGLTFSTTREVLTNTDRELYIYQRMNLNKPWGAARRMTELSTPGTDSGAAFTGDGLAVMFHTDRIAAAPNMADLFVATRTSRSDPFDPPIPVTEVNTAGNESDPTLTGDFRYLVFECSGDLCFSSR